MFELITPLLPRPPFEAASSIANDLFGPQPRRNPKGRESVGLAYGTVSWPLRTLAEAANGLYGDSDHLLHTRTLLNYDRFGMAPEHFVQVRRRAVDGIIGRSSATRTSCHDPRPQMICPLCEQETQTHYGIQALLWPHQAAFVGACWQHGVRLVSSHGTTRPRAVARKVEQAPVWETDLARDVVALCEMARNFDEANATIVARVRDAGFQYEHGYLCRKILIEAFQSYMRNQVQSPLLQAFACNGRMARRIALFLVRDCASVPPILIAILLGFLRHIESTGAAVLPSPRNYGRCGPVGAWTVAQEPRLGRPERYAVLTLRLKGYSGSAVAAIKGMCKTSVHQKVYASGREVEVRDARFALQRRTARAAWRAACSRHGKARVAIVAATEPRAYKWLRKHDREWLSSHSIMSHRVQRAYGNYRLPEQQRRIQGNLQDAMAALVEAGCSLPVNCRAVLKQAGISESAFRGWLFSDVNFARAMRPLFHAQGIQATKSMQERLLAV